MVKWWHFLSKIEPKRPRRSKNRYYYPTNFVSGFVDGENNERGAQNWVSYRHNRPAAYIGNKQTLFCVKRFNWLHLGMSTSPSTASGRPAQRWSDLELQLLRDVRRECAPALSLQPPYPEVVGDRRLMRFIRGQQYDLDKITMKVCFLFIYHALSFVHYILFASPTYHSAKTLTCVAFM